MGNLYFRNSHKEDRLIGEPNEMDEVLDIINKFLKEKNYTSYYTRSWSDEKFTWFDVGSHSEFFKWER